MGCGELKGAGEDGFVLAKKGGEAKDAHTNDPSTTMREEVWAKVVRRKEKREEEKRPSGRSRS